ncbi:unnamed protein product [Diamesa serratosioi]
MAAEVVILRKDNELSAMFREKAKTLLLKVTEENCYEIISNYNKAVACAVKGSQTLGLAFAGRSRVAAYLRSYEACLKNIKHAKLNCYPEDRLEALLLYEENMQLKLDSIQKEDGMESEFFTLSHPENNNLSFMIDNIEIASDHNGHHLITKVPLKCGDVVAMERTFASSSLLESYSKKCGNCNKYGILDLLPCEDCCSVMFCSQRCFETAKKGYHQYECDVLDKIRHSFTSNHTKYLLIKPLFKAMAMFEGSIKYLKHFLDKHKKATPLEVILTRPDMPTEKELLILSVSTSCWRHYTDRERSLRESEYEAMIRLYPKLNDLMKISHYKTFILDFFLKQSKGLVAQMSSVKLGGTDGDLFGSVSALKKFMVHSCAPNMHVFVYDNGDLAHIVQAPIPAGGQLTVGHTYQFHYHKIERRRSNHLKSFGLVCKCVACTNAYPLEQDLHVKNPEMYKTVLEQTLFPQNQITKVIVQKFRNNCSYFDDNVEFYPNKEMVMSQNCNMKIINQLLGRVLSND